MSAISSVFLTLTPQTQHMDCSNHIQAPTDHVTLNPAVEPLAYHLLSADALGPVANSPQAASVDNETSVSQDNDKTAQLNNINPPPIHGTPKDGKSMPFVDNCPENRVPPTTNDPSQDTVGTALTTKFLSPATALKRRLESTKDLIVCPGVYDGFSARIALSIGFDALYMASNTPPRDLLQVCLHQLDRGRHNGLSPRST